MLWYPVEGHPEIRSAPDALVVFGRPKGDRGSYLQWQEENIAPQIVFEVLSPGNTKKEMRGKREFYQRYGVEEYYVYDPDRIKLEGWQRSGDRLEQIKDMNGWVSPLLKIRFELDEELKLYHPNGEPFVTFIEAVSQRDYERQQREQIEQQLEQERQRAERLAAQLKALGIELEE